MTEWKCPKCGAGAHRHGAGGEGSCKSQGECEGLLCECFEYETGHAIALSEERDHGISHSNPCKHAACYHCGWGGVMPRPIAGLAQWERKALEAGWEMPAKRKAELAAAESKPKAKGKRR